MTDIAAPPADGSQEQPKRTEYGLPRIFLRGDAQSWPRQSHDCSDRPVAAVVRGQAAGYDQPGRTLPSLEFETTEVQRLLEAAGYEVVLLEQGRFNEFERLRDEGLRERLVVFHYAGHATPAGLLLQSGDRGEYLVNASQLADLLSPCDNLRVLFLNGCDSRDQLRAFDNALVRAGAAGATDYAFIGAEGRVGDNVASAFATDVYARLAAGSELGVAVRDATASVHEAAIAEGLEGDRAVATLRFKPYEHLEFRLRDGPALIYEAVYDQARQIKLKPFAIYLPLVAIIGMLFALAAYTWDPSPAFRTAFGLQPDPVLKTFVSSWGAEVSAEDLERMRYPAGSPVQHFAKNCSSWRAMVGDRLPVIRTAYGGLNKDYGTVIDMLRTAVLTVALLLIVLKAWHMRFPCGVPILSHVRLRAPAKELLPFAKSALGGSFIGIFTLGLILLVLYHAYWAPANLAKYWAEGSGKYRGVWEGRWVLLHCLDEVWAQSGSAGALLATGGDGTPRTWSAFVDKESRTDVVSTALYTALYERPYAILFVNSAANFLFLMLPIAYVIAKSARFSWYWTDLGLRRAAILFRAPKVNEARIRDALTEVCAQARIATRTYSFVLFIMATVGVFEITVGRVSLASMAQAMTVIAVFVFAVGGLLILIVVFGLEWHRNELLRQLHLAKRKDSLVDQEGSIERQLKELHIFRPLDWAMIAYGAIVIGVSISELVRISNLMGLS